MPENPDSEEVVETTGAEVSDEASEAKKTPTQETSSQRKRSANGSC